MVNSASADFDLRPLLRINGSFYGLFFAACAMLGPYLPLLLEDREFSATELSLLIGLMGSTKILAPSFWGWVSDKSGRRLTWIRFGIVGATAAIVPFCFDIGFYFSLLSLLLFNFFLDAALPLFEVNTLLRLGSHTKFYGKIRGLGTVGYIVAVLVLPVMIQFFGVSVLPWLLVIALLALFALSQLVEEAKGDPLQPMELERKKFSQFFKFRTTYIFIAVALLLHMSYAPANVFFTLYSQELGFTPTQISLFWAIGPFLEIPVFFKLANLLLRFGYLKLIAMSLILLVFRWLMMPVVGDSFIGMFAVMGLHALTFAPFHGAMVFWARDYFGSECAGQAQGLYAGLAFGLGMPVGATIAGFLWNHADHQTIFYFAAAMAGAGLSLIAVHGFLEQKCQAMQEQPHA